MPVSEDMSRPMRFVSWNVNGLRAILGKGFDEIFADADADIFCIQETKLQEGQAQLDYPGYSVYWNCAHKKGYSGTAVVSRISPLSVQHGIGCPEHDTEGRVITLEFKGFYLVNVYTPNSQSELKRLEYRMDWEKAFRKYLCSLDAVKPVIVCGDMNVAHKEIDLSNPKSNRRNPGFTDEERNAFSLLLDSGFVDSFRHLHPDEQTYSWWSYRYNARSKNIGWRIDYFLVSERLVPQLASADIHTRIMGSDHCPVSISLNLPDNAISFS